ncbi:probable C-mannosyltransferase DPY19L4 isoform X2 [Esox lucius]|uniref:Dpy-19 like 4 n=4 Tax=Esox lucius TaxID=8010 RepID=A0AAY5KF73_ESOLU|nr:probable C-mannosyltransferase DPY19L4 isoform X2 [Esox lucius]XP_012988341.1 probable C-mannosyltransferase DPY19L4 isoform X2 [Esox lucius]XP_019899918.1 probable C-mannosyltransferase DPY19L4 isoform X2 [Esox lucius]XP_019899919.1 probable C-mannosyltransferase DPY19L4 isoform X2 [Esox lucius]
MAELRCRKTVVREGECEGEEQKQSESAPQIENSIKVDKDSLMEMCSKNTNGAGGAFCCNQEEQKDEKEEKEKNIKEVADGQNPCPVKRARNACRSLLFQRLVKLFFGCLAAVTCGMMYAVYLSTYHERKFWFSSRQELEREITFQGGSGVYYYYYKHMLTAPSFERGIYELMRDNRTISGQTINTVEHLSLYPELVTSLLYRITGCQDMIEPVYFYIGVVFGLQAVYITALFVSSWMLSGTWVAGMLAVAWYIINRPDTTKVDYAIPQRDNWVLPYFSCQVAALTGFLSDNINSATEMFCYLLMSASTLTFILVWEHSHYVLFIQGLALFFLDSFDLVQSRKMADIHKVYLSSLFLAYVIQFQNTALLSSPLLSLLISSVLARYFQQNMKNGPLVARVMKIFLHFYLSFTTGITFSYMVKRLMPVGDSDFILKFLEVKFGLNTTTDFVINQLLCQECFQTPSQDFFLRLTQASILPFYLLVLLICLMSILETIYRRLSGEPMKTNIILEDGRIGERPEVIYHVFHTMLFGALAMVFEGIKYLWTPYVCMFTAFGVCSPELWMTVFRWLKLKSIHPVVLALVLSTAVPTIIGFSLWREYFPHVIAELSELQEFHDPDTVELMTWIKTHAPMAAVFAGSPQLLGLVKLCSGLAVTSLPLYSDINLQKRSEDTYQVYAMRSAEDVYKILSLHKTSYVIIEESLCNEYHKGCRIKDLLDIANGHVCIKHHSLYSNHTLFTHFDNIGNINIGYMQYMILLSCKLHFFLTLVVALCPQQVVYDKGEIYSFSKHGRFCHEIKLNYSPYTNYFSRVFWNRSYHIYKVNSVISFQY